MENFVVFFFNHKRITNYQITFHFGGLYVGVDECVGVHVCVGGLACTHVCGYT